MTGEETRARPAPGGRARAAVAHLVWWVCAGVGLLLAGAVLLMTLRADAGTQPWSSWFTVADALTPGFLRGGWTREAVWWRESLRDDAVSHSLAAAGWVVIGLLAALLVRPRAGRRVGGARRTTASTTTWSRSEETHGAVEDEDGTPPGS